MRHRRRGVKQLRWPPRILGSANRDGPSNHRACTSSVHTLKPTSSFGPTALLIATSDASRPRAIRRALPGARVPGTFAAQDLCAKLGELLPGLGFQHEGPDQRWYPAIRYESPVIGDPCRIALGGHAGRERRHLHVAANERRANFLQRHEFDLPHVVELEVEETELHAACLGHLDAVAPTPDDMAR